MFHLKKNVGRYSSGLLCLIISLLYVCTKAPENYCSNGQEFNQHTEFCFENDVYTKCGGQNYDPSAQFCHRSNICEQCGFREYNPDREFCDDKRIYAKCEGYTHDYNPQESGCVNDILKKRCGSNFFDNAIEFCDNDKRVRDLCDGRPLVECDGIITRPKCGNAYYDLANDVFCHNNMLINKCGGSEYDPATQQCVNDEISVIFYTLTVNTTPADGGIVSPAGTTTRNAGAQITITATPNAGYAFIGWTGAITSANTNISVVMTGNMTLTANFEKRGASSNPNLTHTLTTDVFPALGGTVIRSPNQMNFADKAVVTVTANAASGYRFVNWTGEGIDNTNSAATTVTMTANSIVTANFEFNWDDVGKIEMVFVQGGTFTMGCMPLDCYLDESPQHRVTVSDFFIGKFEITQAQWVAVMGNNPSLFKDNALHPIETVRWNEVQEFIFRLNRLTGMNYRLPTESEWEFAARGGIESGRFRYSGSNNIDDVAWYSSNTNEDGTRPVGIKKPNELGIHDMSGNVYEWVNDWHGSYAGRGGETNPTGPESGEYRVARGGSWNNETRYCIVSHRTSGYPNVRYFNIGFRIALTSPQ